MLACRRGRTWEVEVGEFAVPSARFLVVGLGGFAGCREVGRAPHVVAALTFAHHCTEAAWPDLWVDIASNRRGTTPASFMLRILVAFRGRSVLKMCCGRREWFANGSRS